MSKKWLWLTIGAVVFGVVWHLLLSKMLGFTERDFAQIEMGMSQEDVLRILGEPGSGRFTRRAPGARASLRDWIRPTTNYVRRQGISWTEMEEIRAEAEEVWRWTRFIQIIGVVFDKDGRVVFKWTDY